MSKKSQFTPKSREEIEAETEAFTQELWSQTDRGAALIGAAFLDDVLEKLLRAYFVNEPKEVDKLLKFDRPLGTFAARITLAYCLGLIEPETRDDLNVIRDIRNKFAHHHQPIDFGFPSIKDKCANLKSVKKVLALISERFDVVPKDGASAATRNNFLMHILLIIMEIAVRIDAIERSDAKEFGPPPLNVARLIVDIMGTIRRYEESAAEDSAPEK